MTPPSVQSDERRFMVTLPPDAVTLLRDIEEAFGAHVRLEWLPEGGAEAGRSNVAPDGTPLIQLHPRLGVRVDVVVHELYHFRLRQEGYPVLEWRMPLAMHTPDNVAAFDQLREQLYDPILHRVFYPRIRRWGINPGESYEDRTRTGLSDGLLPATFSSMNAEAIALYYFKLRLEAEDRSLLKTATAIITDMGKQDGISLGLTLTSLVENSALSSPQEAIAVFISCLNTFYANQFRFSGHSWRSQMLGRHVQQIAPVEIVPAL